jgi:cell division protein ZapA (FtsZ GTPase activity inhibitor)
MKRFRIELASVAAALALMLVLASARTAAADDTGPTKKPAATHTAVEGTVQPSSSETTPPAATPDEKPVKPKKAKRRRDDHLPLYYKGVVTDEQKDKIYSILDDYNPKLKALTNQLKTLTAERDAKLDALLTAEQKAKIQAKRDEAQAKRAAEKAKRADEKESRGKSTKHVATPSTEKPVEKPADQAPAK